MTMPAQLAEGLRRHPKGSRPPRPIAEQLPSIEVKNLKIPRRYGVTNILNLSFKFPDVPSVKATTETVEFQLKSLHRGQPGPKHLFKVKSINTGIGIRHCLFCDCGRPIELLYYYQRRLACLRCCNAIRTSQTCSANQRPLAQATKVESFLKAHPRIKRKARARLEAKLDNLLRQAQTRYKA